MKAPILHSHRVGDSGRSGYYELAIHVRVPTHYAGTLLGYELELPDPPKSPGQRAYEAHVSGPETVAVTWIELADARRAHWEAVAKAARDV